jgi:hypothetical protein
MILVLVALVKNIKNVVDNISTNGGCLMAIVTLESIEIKRKIFRKEEIKEPRINKNDGKKYFQKNSDKRKRRSMPTFDWI